MLPDQRVCNIRPKAIRHALRGVAASVDGKPLCAKTQEADATSIADAHKHVEVQSKGVACGEETTASAVLVSQLDLVFRAAKHVAQFLTIKQHVAW
jgi:hypothetical protein